MFSPSYDLPVAQMRSNELIQQAEEARLIRLLKSQQPGLLSHLQGKVRTWSELMHSQADVDHDEQSIVTMN